MWNSFWIILMVALWGRISFEWGIKPFLWKSCLTGNECIMAWYKRFKNSVLIRLKANVYVWFDGRDVLLYGTHHDRACPENSSTAFVWDVKTGSPKGILCSRPVAEVKNMYASIPRQWFYVPREKTQREDVHVYGLIAHLVEKGIIVLP